MSPDFDRKDFNREPTLNGEPIPATVKALYAREKFAVEDTKGAHGDGFALTIEGSDARLCVYKDTATGRITVTAGNGQETVTFVLDGVQACRIAELIGRASEPHEHPGMGKAGRSPSPEDWD